MTTRLRVLSGIVTLGLVSANPSTAVGLQGQGVEEALPQSQTDAYTRYELQEPGSAGFRILYEVSATTPGARFYYNPIRAGAEEEVHGVTDMASGRPLEWEVVDGEHARANGHPRANPEGRFIKVSLSRPVPDGGQGRILIDKTYWDHASYSESDDTFVFERSLGIRRNAVVLPAGYELIGANYPVQVDTESDGRIRVSFMNPGPGAVDLRISGRALEGGARPAARVPEDPHGPTEPGAGGPGQRARVDWTFPERAHQNRDITYYLQQPETHSFRLFHDYTETRPGLDRYLNIVRAGSSASDPEAYNLDTGEQLEVEQLKGSAISDRGIDIGSQVTDETEVVVIWYPPITEGSSTRLRIWETYTDPGRYVDHGEEFVWDRNFGRTRNTVVLPEGWLLSANAIPGVIDTTEDGLIRIRYINPRPDGLQVFIKGRRR